MLSERMYKEVKICDFNGSLKKQWYVWFYLKDKRGKWVRRRKYVPTTFKTVGERWRHALALQRTINEMLRDGAFTGSPIEVPTIDEGLQSILNWKSQHCRKRTMDSYRSAVTMFLQELNDPKKLISDLERREVVQVLEDMATKRNWKAKTYNLNLGYLKSLLDNAIEKEWIDHNPFHKIKTLPETEPEHRYWDPLEVEVFFDYTILHNPNLYITGQLIYKCGLRPEEIRQLVVGSIEFESSLIWVEGRGAKNRKRQAVTVPNQLLLDLERFTEEKDDEAPLVGLPNDPSKHVSRNYFNVNFNKTRKDLKLPKSLQLYGLKHTGALEMDRMGLTPKEIQEQLRHHSLAQTAEYMRRVVTRANSKLKDW